MLIDHYSVRMLKEEPHSQKEAEAAVGLATDNGKERQTQSKMDTDIDTT